MVTPTKVIQKIINAENEVADFIQNGPSDGLPGYVRDQYRKRCDQFANLPEWARLLGNAPSGSLGRICQPYWDDRGFDGPVNPGPPFNGGQCPGDLYRVFYTFTGPAGQAVSNNTGNFKGPVSGLIWGAVNQFGAVPVSLISGDPTQNPVLLGNTVAQFRGQGSITNITRMDGLTDSCGNPPSAPLTPGPNPPPNPGPTPGPEPRDDPDGGPIPELPIPPYEDPVYGPTPIEPGDEPTPPPPPAAGGDGLPGAPDSVGDPAGATGTDGEGEDIDFGPPPEGRVWVGALVEYTVDSRYGNIPGTGPPNTVYPYVIGNASLRYSVGRSSSSRVRSRWHEMFRPVSTLVVEGAFIQARPGCSASVRPVSAIICPENPCGDDEDG